MSSVMFKYRTKTWKLSRDAYCFHLQKKTGVDKDTGEDVWGLVGYYKEPKYVVKKLVEEHFISVNDGKEFIASLHSVMESVGKVINKALRALPDDSETLLEENSATTKGGQ